MRLLPGIRISPDRRPVRVACVALGGALAVALAGCAVVHAPAAGGAAAGAAATGTASHPASGSIAPAALPATGSSLKRTIAVAVADTDAAKAVTISLVPDMNRHVKAPAPATVTSPAEVRKLTALVDSLPFSPPGRFSCPMDAGAALVLTFRAHAGASASATATMELEGCGWVNFALGGAQQPSLGAPNSGTSTAASALKIAGLNWKLASYAS